MNVLLWHVHGSWTTAFVQGPHRYLLPVTAGRDAFGRGRARTWDWPDSAVEVAPAALRDAAIDVVIVQRPEDVVLADTWLGGRRVGFDLPGVWLEHNAPQGLVNDMRHPSAGRRGFTTVHVTHCNDVFWDCGTTPTTVIEHGIVDPGHRYTGELPHQAVVLNDAVRRWRVTGTDLLPTFEAAGPVDLFGIGASHLGGIEDLQQDELHTEMARRRVYVHPVRWTSLGLSLLEAMHLGMPVVALATTEVPDAVPPEAGVIGTRVDVLVDAARRLLRDPEEAAARGKAARASALARYGLGRFLADWDRLLTEVTR